MTKVAGLGFIVAIDFYLRIVIIYFTLLNLAFDPVQ
jgi:hypothetical protein